MTSTTRTARPSPSSAVRSRAAGGAVAGGDVAVVRELADGRVVVAVADVRGHGEGAAPVAKGLQQAVDSLAGNGTAPARALALLDAHVRSVGHDVLATAAYAVLDPATGTALCASAGHPPWVLAADGRAGFLPVVPGPPLGLGCSYEETALGLATSGVLLAYSDGLVERRGEDIDTGLDRLLDAVVHAPQEPVQQLVDTVFEELGAAEDDVLLLAVSLRAAAAGRILTIPAQRGVQAPGERDAHDDQAVRSAARRRSGGRCRADRGGRGLREQRDGRAAVPRGHPRRRQLGGE